MEVLNQNQRNGAIKRLVLISLSCTLLLGTMLALMSMAVKNVGDTEMLLVEKEHVDLKADFEMMELDMKLTLDSLNDVLGLCEESSGNNELLGDCIRDKNEAQKQLKLKKKYFRKNSDKKAKLAVQLQNCQNQY